MTDYSNSVVYKIYKEDMSEFYIGSTHNEHQRKISHKTNCNNEKCKQYNYKVYKFIRSNGGYDNWKLEVLEIYPCDNEEQLVEREDYYYDLLKPLLNSQRPLRTKEELKEQHTISGAKYREKYKEEIANYREEHKAGRQKYDAEYREKNKEGIQKKRHKKYDCECGGNYTTGGNPRHCRTNKHIEFMKNNK